MDAPSIDPWWMVHAKLAFASFCGGIVRLIFRPADSLIKALWLLFGCVTCGFYGTPVALRFWELGDEFAGAIGALVGFIGLTIAGGALRAIEGFDFKALLARWIGKESV